MDTGALWCSRFAGIVCFSLRDTCQDFSMRFCEFRNLQLSICAEFEEEKTIRNWELQGGRQIPICQYVLQPGIITNCLNIPLSHIRRPTKRYILSKIDLTTDVFQHYNIYIFQQFWIISAKKYSRPLFKHARMQRSVWWFRIGFTSKRRDQLLLRIQYNSETWSVSETGHEVFWGPGHSQESGADEGFVRLLCAS